MRRRGSGLVGDEEGSHCFVFRDGGRLVGNDWVLRAIIHRVILHIVSRVTRMSMQLKYSQTSAETRSNPVCFNPFKHRLMLFRW